MEERIKFKKKLMTIGGSQGLTIPPELLGFLDVKLNDNMILTGESGKYGNFIAIYKEVVDNNDTNSKPVEEQGV
jgi:hypothetical protein